MAAHFLSAGYELSVFNRTRAKADSLIQQGAQWCGTPGEVARSAGIILSMVGYPEDVERIYLGAEGVIAHAAEGSLLIDLTTSRPDLAIRIAEAASRKKLDALDAPVSGGDRGAREATLSVMVGGLKDAFERAKPVLKIIGKNIVYQGPAGSGQHAKLCNQIAIASGMLGVCEAFHYAEQAGLSPATVLESISSGAAGSWSLSNLAPRILNEDYSPGFYVRHFIKDLKIALEGAEAMQVDLPGLKLAHRLYQALSDMGADSQGTQALMRWYREFPGK